jgi:hypothetical protein
MRICGYGSGPSPGRQRSLTRAVLQIQHDGQISSVLRNRVKPRNEKYSALQKRQIRCITLTVPGPLRGASRSSRNVGLRMRWTLWRQAGLLARRNAHGGRRSRVVLAPRPWRQVGGRIPPATVANNAAHRGEHEISRKTIARGKPVSFGGTCSDYARMLSLAAYEAAGAASARLSLRPLRFRGTMRWQASGKSCRGNESVCSQLVIARLGRAIRYSRGASD